MEHVVQEWPEDLRQKEISVAYDLSANIAKAINEGTVCSRPLRRFTDSGRSIREKVVVIGWRIKKKNARLGLSRAFVIRRNGV